jgi:hypothetical protein
MTQFTKTIKKITSALAGTALILALGLISAYKAPQSLAASTDSLDITCPANTQCNGDKEFYHYNEWVYADVTNIGTEPLRSANFKADVQSGADDYFFLYGYTPGNNTFYAEQRADYKDTACFAFMVVYSSLDDHKDCLGFYNAGLNNRPDDFEAFHNVNGRNNLGLKPGATLHLKLRVAKKSSFGLFCLWHNDRGVFLEEPDQPVKVHYETRNEPACDNGAEYKTDGLENSC